jgi:hypothetical protein
MTARCIAPAADGKRLRAIVLTWPHHALPPFYVHVKGQQAAWVVENA